MTWQAGLFGPLTVIGNWVYVWTVIVFIRHLAGIRK